MGNSKLKTALALVIVGIIAAAIVYFVEQQQIVGLLAENQNLESELQKVKNDLAAATAANEDQNDEIKQSQKNLLELLKLRNEVTQLRRQLAVEQTEKQQLQTQIPNNPKAESSASANGIKTLNSPYITKDQLKFVGSATPEAALQSSVFAMYNGENYNDFVSSITPEAQSSTNFPTRESFQRDEQNTQQTFAGLQVLAEKAVSDNQVEIEAMFDSVENNPDGSQKINTQYVVAPFAKVGGEWKSNGPGQPYQTEWDHPTLGSQ
jgi:hypothetical protein